MLRVNRRDLGPPSPSVQDEIQSLRSAIDRLALRPKEDGGAQAALTDIKERLAAIEGRLQQPSAPPDNGDLVERLSNLEAEMAGVRALLETKPEAYEFNISRLSNGQMSTVTATPKKNNVRH